MIILTFDSDWVPDFVLAPIIQKLEKEKIRATIFFTSPVEISKNSYIEAALHPNFMADSTQGNAVEAILEQMLGWFPGACGVRTHRLFWYSNLADSLMQGGILYDSSIFLPFHPHLEPIKYGTFIRIPFWWSDNFHLSRQLAFDRIELPNLEKPGLKVFNFHPLHIYLNTNNPGDHRKNLPYLRSIENKTPAVLSKFVNSGKGVNTFFNTLCDHIKKNRLETYFMKNLVEKKNG